MRKTAELTEIAKRMMLDLSYGRSLKLSLSPTLKFSGESRSYTTLHWHSHRKQIVFLSLYCMPLRIYGSKGVPCTTSAFFIIHQLIRAVVLVWVVGWVGLLILCLRKVQVGCICNHPAIKNDRSSALSRKR